MGLTKNGKTEAIVTSEEESEDDEENDVEEEVDDEDLSEEGGEEEDSDDLDDEEGLEEAVEEEEDAAEDDESIANDEEEETDDQKKDTFHLHFERGLGDNLLQLLTSKKPYKVHELQWRALGHLSVHLPDVEEVGSKDEKKSVLGETEYFVKAGTLPELKVKIPLKEYGVKEQLCKHLKDGLPFDSIAEDLLTPLQQELFTLAHEYRDIYYPEVNYLNCDEVRKAYCLHLLNHVMKSRDRILNHNDKLKRDQEKGVQTEEEYRDQGLVRPRVLIITPLKNSALKIVEILAAILLGPKGQIINKPKFYEEFGVEKDEEAGKSKVKEEEKDKIKRKPEDYEAIFAGNSDDSFRMGISVAKRTLKLYAGFYVSDILIASPLGLRTIIDEDSDFLCSVEVLIMDQTDILYMQNWDHVLQVFQ